MAQRDIIESFIMGKSGNEQECEDVIIVSEHFYAVIDGVTSKFPIKYEGKSTGRYCAELLGNAIFSLDRNASAKDALEALNNEVNKAYGDTKITEENKIQASIIIYSKARQEIFSYGDCQLIINGKSFDHKKRIDTLLEELRAFAVKTYLKEGGKEEDLYQNDIGRETILPFLKKQSLFANKEGHFGYAVIDGTGINESLIKIYKLNEGDEVVLASDGYPKLFPTLKESEDHLAFVLEVDPLSINENMQTKMKSRQNLSFDDRSYLRFVVK